MYESISFAQLPSAMVMLLKKVDELTATIQHLQGQERHEAEELFDVTQTAEYLKLSPHTIYKLVERRELPSFKLNDRKLYFSKVELTKWVKQGRRKTNAEIAAEASTYIINTSRKSVSKFKAKR
ncbi:helix-turn-helix domain-containing protein [Tellurirhabdus rosea]|uniref:helix-turn-helix domain-containing protein n=1 Tax=Tellurirhabdus rosea TaxID=2674997 RepID=UPI00225441EC|nr:helix-turn-helix domain-containing protein [Tellurirhabdus rosea]